MPKAVIEKAFSTSRGSTANERLLSRVFRLLVTLHLRGNIILSSTFLNTDTLTFVLTDHLIL